jgi:hypothetical protein
MYDLQINTIPRGALIFDRTGRPIGVIHYVQTPDIRRANALVTNYNGIDNRQLIWDFGEDILELAFGGDDQFSDELITRMENQGYLHVVKPDGTGYFVFGDELDHKEGGAVFLNVEEHDLLRH